MSPVTWQTVHLLSSVRWSGIRGGWRLYYLLTVVCGLPSRLHVARTRLCGAGMSRTHGGRAGLLNGGRTGLLNSGWSSVNFRGFSSCVFGGDWTGGGRSEITLNICDIVGIFTLNNGILITDGILE